MASQAPLFPASDQLSSFPGCGWVRLVRDKIEVGEIYVPAFLFEAPLSQGLSCSPKCLIKVLYLLELLHLDWGLSEEISNILRDTVWTALHTLWRALHHPSYRLLLEGGVRASARGSRTNQFLLALLSAQLLLCDGGGVSVLKEEVVLIY